MHHAAIAEYILAVAEVALLARFEGSGVVEAVTLFGQINPADDQALVDDLGRTALGVDGKQRFRSDRSGIDDGDVAVAIGGSVNAGKGVAVRALVAAG